MTPIGNDAGTGEVVAVLVVDDHAPFRLAARAVLRRTDGFELVGEAASGAEAIAMTAELRPALVLMDVKLPGISGIEATRRIVAEHPATVVFLCSTYRQSDLPAEAGESGARAYLRKEDLAPEVLIRLWSHLADGEPSAFTGR